MIISFPNREHKTSLSNIFELESYWSNFAWTIWFIKSREKSAPNLWGEQNCGWNTGVFNCPGILHKHLNHANNFTTSFLTLVIKWHRFSVMGSITNINILTRLSFEVFSFEKLWSLDSVSDQHFFGPKSFGSEKIWGGGGSKTLR